MTDQELTALATNCLTVDTITPEIAHEAAARFHRREDEPIE